MIAFANATIHVSFEGVQLVKDQERLKFKISTAFVDYDTGSINQIDYFTLKSYDFRNSPWNHINKYPRMHPLHQLKSQGNSIQRTEPDRDYIIFTHSDLSTDSGQTTVPFWDAQPVAPEPVAPLGGIGLIWKNVDQSGGFVAPVVFPARYKNTVAKLLPALMEQLINNFTTKWENVTIEYCVRFNLEK